MQTSDVSAGVHQVTLSGFLDAAAVAKLEVGFQAVVASSNKSAIVDMTAVEFCGSLGVRMLLAAARVAERRGRRMIIAGARPEVLEVFETVGLTTLIPVAGSVAEAREQIGA